MLKYKGYKYFKDKDNLWKVILDEGHFFIVALDDSKIKGKKEINLSMNNQETCKRYISWLNN